MVNYKVTLSVFDNGFIQTSSERLTNPQWLKVSVNVSLLLITESSLSVLVLCYCFMPSTNPEIGRRTLTHDK